MLTAIVPVLQEVDSLPALLRQLRGEVDEVVVSDGGSTDGTPELAERLGARVVRGPRGRGAQLNRGAAAAGGDLLWFLHADSSVPRGAGEALRQARADWGCFATRVQSADPRLRFCGRWMTLRARGTGSCTGDMGIWVRRPFFEALGGFRPLGALEDLDLSDRARRAARWQVLGPPLGTSARRWEVEGVNRTILRMWALRAGWRLGLDPEWLARSYRSAPRPPRASETP